ncbi:MAG: alginate lyase family protein [Planctomycetaceae bacterium]|nr:alginate lyase family protein [Planctomycetaceae bacterium]
MLSHLRRDLERVYHVTWPLKWGQVLAYVYRKARPVTRPSAAAMSAASRARWRDDGRYQPPFVWGPHAHQSAPELQAGRFTLLGKTFDLHATNGHTADGIQWSATKASKHWQKMLHSFDWLGALDAEQGRAMVDAYCERMKLPLDHMALQPWTLAFRIQSIVRFHAEHTLNPQVAPYVAEWAELLALNLEYRLTGNHLLKDAIGLAFAARFLDTPAAATWRVTSDRLIRDLLAEQVGADGGHDERTPMYHALMLYDLLDLLSILAPQDPLHDVVRGACQKMVTFQAGTTHPDGEIANLNDSGFGVAPPPRALFDKARSFGITPPPFATGYRWYADFGVAVLERDDWWVIVDAGIPCAPHLAGHGHADTLTIEASLAGQRLLVDTGVSSYEDLSVRNRERGTLAHNTALIGAANSSDVYSVYRIGRRAQIVAADGGANPEEHWFSATHEGYRPLPGAPLHTRRVAVNEQGELHVCDRIEAREPQLWQLNWHLHPAWRVISSSDGESRNLDLQGPEGRRVRVTCSHGTWSCEAVDVHLHFGRPEQTTAIRCHDLPTNVDVTTKFTPI